MVLWERGSVPFIIWRGRVSVSQLSLPLPLHQAILLMPNLYPSQDLVFFMFFVDKANDAIRRKKKENLLFGDSITLLLTERPVTQK